MCSMSHVMLQPRLTQNLLESVRLAHKSTPYDAFYIYQSTPSILFFHFLIEFILLKILV
jgi:hypothetical protein